MNKSELELMRNTALKYRFRGIIKASPPLTDDESQKVYKAVKQAAYRATHKRKD